MTGVREAIRRAANDSRRGYEIFKIRSKGKSAKALEKAGVGSRDWIFSPSLPEKGGGGERVEKRVD